MPAADLSPFGRTTPTVNSKRRFILISTVVLTVAAIWCVRAFTGWESITVQLDSESSVRIRRKHTHPFLAEYEREVAVFHSDRRLETLDYPKDTGGGFPMHIRFYADSTRRVVRITDSLHDRLIDLNSGKFVPEDNPPEGKELTSFVREAALPELKRSVEVTEDMQLTQPKSASMAVPPNPALERTALSRALWSPSERNPAAQSSRSALKRSAARHRFDDNH